MKKIILYPTIITLILSLIGGYLLYVTYIQKVIVTGHALLPAITKDELVQKSDLIAIAKVSHLRPKQVQRVSGDGLPDVSTEVTLKVEKILKSSAGSVSNEIVVEVLGGVISNTHVTIDGVATFQENERVLVFLQESDNGNFTVYGWMNGKYELDGEKIKTSEMARFNSIFENISTLEQITNEVRKHKINDAVNISTDKLNLDITPNKDANSEADMIIKKSQ